MTKLKWRRTWFSVHKWIGLILAILIIPLCLSGAALVYGQALDHALNPQRYATTGAQLLPADRYAAAAMMRAAPGERVAQLTYAEGGGGPVQVALAPAVGGAARGGPPARTVVYLEPRTARVLDVASSNGGLIRFIHQLHGSLQVPGGWGRTIVGWIGVAMMISAFTGLWLWWPTIGSVRRALHWGRHRNLDTNIHQTLGFWICLPLFVLSLTGAWIAFPAFFGTLTGGVAPRGPDRTMQARARPVATTRLTAQTAVARAGMILPGAVRSVTWPTERKPDWTVAIGAARGRGVSVADDGGVAALAPDQGVAGGQNRLVRGIHEGSVGGPVWRLIVFVAGLIPAVLAVTGVVMWWRARGWKAQLRARQVARA
ncbi:PepSY-associated TM helix domain-containing protein [Sphingomonas sp.]|uniref:PepSY-associated TM helix domain-containing protein n=1 Tax=Sphingomonas sp. TaxID=28214 RepID=UPI003CC5E36B